jgi:hypothetical protein
LRELRTTGRTGRTDLQTAGAGIVRDQDLSGEINQFAFYEATDRTEMGIGPHLFCWAFRKLTMMATVLHLMAPS